MESLSRYPAHITYDYREELARYHHNPSCQQSQYLYMASLMTVDMGPQAEMR